MSSPLLADRSAMLVRAVPASARHLPPGGVERRRPGRMENASPELIALMRKPDRAARMRVALYDAPGFLLPEARRPVADGRRMLRTAVAVAACSGLCSALLHVMFVAWG